MSNKSLSVEIQNSDYATDTTFNDRMTSLNNTIASNFGNQSIQLTGIENNSNSTVTHLANIDIKLQNQSTIDSKLATIRDDTSDIKDKLPPLTGTPTYFEFTGLNVNDSSVSRLVQNSTGSTVYVTRICIFFNIGTTSIDYNDWLGSTGSVEHVIDVCSTNNNYPTDSERIIIEADNYAELVRRYNVTYEHKAAETLGNSWRNQYFYVTFDRPILLENNNYIRLFKNGDASSLSDYHVTVQGYYHVNEDITTPIII